jgi:hypothetical protein
LDATGSGLITVVVFVLIENDYRANAFRVCWLRENATHFLLINLYRFFHPPRCPGAPPVDRGAGPNSGPDWRESVGWKILLPLLLAGSSGPGLRGSARVGR